MDRGDKIPGSDTYWIGPRRKAPRLISKELYRAIFEMSPTSEKEAIKDLKCWLGDDFNAKEFIAAERQIEDEHEQTLKLGNGWNFPSEGFRWRGGRGGEIYGSQYWEAHDRRQEEYKRDSEARQIREAKHNEECRQARTA